MGLKGLKGLNWDENWISLQTLVNDVDKCVLNWVEDGLYDVTVVDRLLFGIDLPGR